MKHTGFISSCIAVMTLAFVACNNAAETDEGKEPTSKTPVLKEENISYSADGVTMNGYVAYDSAVSGKRPVVLVIPEWWGLNDYPKRRARELAELGYLAMAIDMYGDGKTAEDPKTAGELAMPFYTNPAMAKTRFDAALAKIKTYPQAGDKTAAIGYCFGGGMVLAIAKMGEDLDGVVSFHGNLNVVRPQKDSLKAKVLVCHGAEDEFVKQPEVDQFKKQMDSVGASYTFKVYPGSQHAFTNPNATETGKKFQLPISYNAAADTASWKDMKEFFGTVLK